MTGQPAYTDADVALVANHIPLGFTARDPYRDVDEAARAVLDAVAPAIAARALREAADALLPPYNCELRHDGSEDPEVARWVGYCAETDRLLRDRADGIEAGR